MPDNLFEQANAFYIEDVDGILLGSPNIMRIREPVNFSNIKIKLSRGETSHGFNYEYFDEDHEIGLHRVKYPGSQYSGYEIAMAIFDAKGVDGKCNLQYYENGAINYVGSIDFEAFVKTNTQVKVKARSIVLDDLFRTRYDVEVSMDAPESIDGQSITPPTPISMFLHSKQIDMITFLELNEPVEIDLADNDDVDPCFFVFGYDGITFPDGSQSVFLEESGSIGTTGSSSLWPYTLNSSGKVYIFGTDIILPIPEESDYYAEFTFRVVGRLISTTGQQFVRILSRDIEKTLVDSTPDDTIAKILYEDDVTAGTLEFDFEETVYWQKTTGDSNSSQIRFEIHSGPNATVTGDDYVEIDVAEITVTVPTVGENSFADVYEASDCFNHVLNAITGESSILESSFFSSQLPDAYLTNGYKIRALPDKPLYLSFEMLFENWAQPLFGLGYQVYNDNGNFKMLVERYSEFYQDVEIDYIESVFVNSFEVFLDASVHFNEIVTGYKIFPSSTDENIRNNLDEFNSKHTHALPLRSVKKKKEYVSDIIASGYKIENQRREQFSEVPKETVSDDDKPFCIKGIESDRYEDVVVTFDNAFDRFIFSGAFYNFIEGETITIDGSDDNDSSFTISSISVDNVNSSFFTSLYTVEAVTFETPKFVTIIKSSSFVRAERDEPYDTLEGITSPESAYNVGFNPKNMLLNQSPIFLSGLNKKDTTETIKTQRVFLNDQMTFEFSSGQGTYVLGSGTEISMDGNLEIGDINSNMKLFTGERVRLKCKLSQTRVINIRNALLNQHESTNLGYIRVNDGYIDWKVFVDSFSYNPLKEDAEIEGRVKYES